MCFDKEGKKKQKAKQLIVESCYIGRGHIMRRIKYELLHIFIQGKIKGQGQRREADTLNKSRAQNRHVVGKPVIAVGLQKLIYSKKS